MYTHCNLPQTQLHATRPHDGEHIYFKKSKKNKNRSNKITHMQTCIQKLNDVIKQPEDQV